jgi:hypothetical protein
MSLAKPAVVMPLPHAWQLGCVAHCKPLSNVSERTSVLFIGEVVTADGAVTGPRLLNGFSHISESLL